MDTQTSGAAVPNAFSLEFLGVLRERNEPSTAAEAEMAGPWKLVDLDGQTGICRDWENPRVGDSPYAAFPDRETALLFLTVLPLFSPEITFAGATGEVGEGVRIQKGGEQVGWCQVFNEDLLFAAHLAAALARSPRSLATLLEAAGPLVLEQVGRILREEVR
jgi:hypothetical protein